MKESKVINIELKSVGRRKAVKKIVGGVSALAAYNMLPIRWSKPIIEQVFLPAHAQTSGSGLCCGLIDPCGATWISGYQDSNIVVIQVNGEVTPPIGGLPVSIVATGNPDVTATSTVTTTTDAEGNFSAQITLQTATGLGSVAVKTTVEGADGSANCDIEIPQRRPSQPQIFSSPSSITEINPVTGNGLDIFIVFNGVDSLILESGDPPSIPSDAIIRIDTDNQVDGFEATGPGSNWTAIGGSVNFGVFNNDGSHSIEVTGASGAFTLAFDIDVIVNTNDVTMTVDNVSIIPTP